MKNYDESVGIIHNSIDSASGKTNVLLNLIKFQRPNIGSIYLYVKDPSESKC